ncbi:MAG: hypothetical protein NZ900_09300 [Synergistetes bacterium]|nr:hypothetical protein [Synergistota bacterium]MDW8193112.1 hypothetical protein [Synergistota bacterium]
MRLLLLANGPGELYSWGLPLARNLEKRGWEVYLKILPCQFSSGYEKYVAFTEGLKFNGDGKPNIILQLGGDAFWGWKEKIRYRVPLLRYGFGLGGYFSFAYDAYLLPYDGIRKGLRGKRAFIVGSLSSDRVCDYPSREEARKVLRINNEFLLGIFPGSRLPIWRRASEFLEKMISFLPRDIYFLVGRSPFIPEKEPSFLPEASPELVISASDLLLTLPGTNTLEAAALGTPMLLLFPFSFLDLVPVSGFYGLLSSFPLLGKSLKFLLLKALLRREEFLSWPNRLSGERIVPEMVGEFSPKDVALEIARLKEEEEPLRRMRARLPEIVGGPGASWKIERVLREFLAL